MGVHLCAIGRSNALLRMGADNDGKLTALDHRTKTTSSTFDVFSSRLATSRMRFMPARRSLQPCVTFSVGHFTRTSLLP